MDEYYFDDKIYIDWSTWSPACDKRVALVSNQLRIEVGSNHVIFPFLRNLHFIAQDDASDSILVSNTTDPETAFFVHPTFSKRTESNSAFPSTHIIPADCIPKHLR